MWWAKTQYSSLLLPGTNMHCNQGLAATVADGQTAPIKLQETRYCCVKPTADRVGVQPAASEVDFLEHCLHSRGQHVS